MKYYVVDNADNMVMFTFDKYLDAFNKVEQLNYFHLFGHTYRIDRKL